MNIRKTCQGFECSAIVGCGIFAYRFSQHYIGYTKKEAIIAFTIFGYMVAYAIFMFVTGG